MAEQQPFTQVVLSLLTQILPDAHSQHLANVALDAHRGELLDIATSEANKHIRRREVEAANAKLLDKLQDLTDTEEVELVEPEADKTPQNRNPLDGTEPT